METENILIQLGKIEVMDEIGNPVRLANLWKDKKTAFVFIRHFG